MRSPTSGVGDSTWAATTTRPASARPSCSSGRSVRARRSTWTPSRAGGPSRTRRRGRRAGPDEFVVRVDADKVRDDAGANRLTNIVVTFEVRFPEGDGGDAARTLLPDAVKRSHDVWCTVSRTVESGTPIATRVD